MKLSPPPGITLSMPQQYVASLEDAAVATIRPSDIAGSEELEIEVRDGQFLWRWAGHTLSISLAHLHGARVAKRNTHGNTFLGFCLNFGTTPEAGGVFLVTAVPEHEPWFREFASKLEDVLPSGIQWSV